MVAAQRIADPVPEPAVTPVLEVNGLSVAYGEKPVHVVRDVSFSLAPGEALGVVGESGCGKTQTMLAVLQLLPHGGRISGGSVRLEGRELVGLSSREMRGVRGRGMALVSQDALSALNPAMTIGMQMAEPLIHNEAMDEDSARTRCIDLLRMVGIPGAEARLDGYPHELSGGMRQRVLIAMAISGRPRILIADEPTTALDVTIQAQILRLLDRLRRELGMALVLISHDLGVVAGLADRVAIMYAGRIVEAAPAAEIFARPVHPYARALLEAMPRVDGVTDRKLRPIPGLPPDPARPIGGCAFHPRCAHRIQRCAEDRPLLESLGQDGHSVACWLAKDVARMARTEARDRVFASTRPQTGRPKSEIVVRDLRVHFPVRAGILRRTIGMLRAVDGVSFAIPRGRTVALVGESGSGKTTTARALLGLAPLLDGTVSLFGHDLGDLRCEAGALPRLGQMVFQDPYGSLNPRMTVGAALSEVLSVHELASGHGIAQRIAGLLESVGLRAEAAHLHPHELSGGQRQRIAIARALAIEPQFLVCDEVVSALDVSIQGQIVNLLMELQRERDLTYLFISHDLGVVRHISHRIVVMYGGRVMEIASRDQLFALPRHPYTHALLAAVPVPDPEIQRKRMRIELRSEPPDPTDMPSGCRYHRSCRFATERCRVEEPAPAQIEQDRFVACHRWNDDEVLTVLSAMTRG